MIAKVEARYYKTVEEFLQEYRPNHALITEHLTYEEVSDIVVSALSKAEGKYLYRVDVLDKTISVESEKFQKLFTDLSVDYKYLFTVKC